MASIVYRLIYWLEGDQLWSLAERFYPVSGYRNISDFANAIVLANPNVVSWRLITPGSQIAIPLPATQTISTGRTG